MTYMQFVRCDCILPNDDEVVDSEDCKSQTREFEMPVCPRRPDVCEPYCPNFGTLTEQQYNIEYNVK